MQENVIYQPDVLGNDFEQLTLQFPDDYEGKVTATLIKKNNNITSSKAVLYLHGFNDYFFQEEMAKTFEENNINFYALDLRKYGRSLLPHQKLNNLRDLKEYDAEIMEALKIIEVSGNDTILLAGHSTGGLTATYFAARHPTIKIIKAVFVNCPFFQFNVSSLELAFGIPLLSSLAKYFPNFKINPGLSDLYGKSLHKSEQGFYSYNLKWKPVHVPNINLSFIKAIHQAQLFIQQGCEIKMPLLVMHSDKSSKPKILNEEVFKTDIVLNVAHINKYAQKIEGPVSIVAIPNGIHDLLLSAAPVKEIVYEKIFAWLKSIAF